ncbi:MAG TPA: hypothetical protein VMU50_10955 [Polyangia bacterium]|nr:hypothetical protein [Polyangia bacterium]
MDRLRNGWRLLWTKALAGAIFVGRLFTVLLAVPIVWGARAVNGLRRRLARPAPRVPARARPRVLLIGGTINHTTQVEQIAAELPECETVFTWYYGDQPLELMRRLRWLESTALGGKLRARCLRYLQDRNLPLDLGGTRGDYDLAVTCSDLAIPENIRGRPIVLVQEGMTDPEDLIFHIIKRLRLPPWLATTSSTTGLSHAYQRFCVASDGYRELFIGKGVPAEKIVVTGIPNFDDCGRFLKNDFPHRGYVLVCSSDIRETARWEDRPGFIRKVQAIAAGRPVIWKVHPNENVARARAELGRLAPGALLLDGGSAEEMIANCDVLITQYSSTAYVGLALGKEVHSFFDVAELARLCPIQNGRTSARRIADVCRQLLGLPMLAPSPERHRTEPALPRT